MLPHTTTHRSRLSQTTGARPTLGMDAPGFTATKSFESREDLSSLATVLAPFSIRAKAVNVDWLLIGNQARELVLGLENLPRSMAIGEQPTEEVNVELAVCVDSWGDLESLRTALMDDEGALGYKVEKRRLRMPGGARLTLLPFCNAGWGFLPGQPNPELPSQVMQLLPYRAKAILPGSLPVQVPNLYGYIALEILTWRASLGEGQSRSLSDHLAWLERIIPALPLYSGNEYPPDACDSIQARIQNIGAKMRAELDPRIAQTICNTAAREAGEHSAGLLSNLAIGLGQPNHS